MSKFINVTKEEFDRFVSTWPNKLERNVTSICEPPLLTMNDFSDGRVWPESVVARVSLFESYPRDGQEPYRWSPNTYQVLADAVGMEGEGK